MILAYLEVDGKCGPATIGCIKDFQGHIVGMANPDGRMDVGGSSSRSLRNYETQKQSLVFQKSGNFAPLLPPAVMKSKPAPVNTNVRPKVVSTSDPRALKTRAAIAEAYGAISKDKKWSRKAEFYKKYVVPAEIKNDKDYSWINVYDPKKRKVSNIWCHKAMHSFLDAALKNLKKSGLLNELTEFGGSHNIRATRGTTNWSAHSWGLAIDVNMTGNGLGETPKMSAEFAKCFTDAGFGWGGHYNRKDGMHFTIAGFDLPRKN